VRVARGALGVVALLALAACLFDSSEEPAPEPAAQSAALEIVVAPEPLRILWACPAGLAFCYGSLDSTLTIRETAGVGVRLDKLDMVARESVTSSKVGELHFTGAEIAARVGTQRVEPGGSLAMRPVVEGWAYPADLPRPTLNVEIVVEGSDDRGNAIRQTKTVPVT
jgi:hypothetical protein